MNELFTDFHEDSRWRHHQDELDAMPNRGELKPSTGAFCLKCGWAIDMSKHYGAVYYFDRGTDALHLCRPTFRESMRLLR